ncbi:MAG: VOC family protein [Acidimicrobiaceae bacterium]|nr:VOC family protein [Acidimicrobiaceae bacterium]
MLDHLAIEVADVDTSAEFYLEVLAPIGIAQSTRLEFEGEVTIGLSGPSGPASFWLNPTQNLETREVHIAFKAKDVATVDAVYKAALKAEKEVIHAPREYPEYHPGYYAVFIRDPDGHSVEAVFHGRPNASVPEVEQY